MSYVEARYFGAPLKHIEDFSLVSRITAGQGKQKSVEPWLFVKSSYDMDRYWVFIPPAVRSKYISTITKSVSFTYSNISRL